MSTNTNGTPVLWIHGDALTPHNPAWQAHPSAPALFVWDEALLRQWHISLKRIVFMYECLLELPVTIRRGDVVTQLAAFAAEHDTQQVVTVHSVAPRFANLRQQLMTEKGLQVEVLATPPLVPDDDYDLKRFSRYWRQAKKTVFSAYGNHNKS